MADMHCPGRTSATAYLSSTIMACPDCGREVEIFGDEIRVKCRCGSYVFRDALPACAQWCDEASRCFGHVGDLPKSVRGNAGAAELKQQEERFREMQARILACLNKCMGPDKEGDSLPESDENP